MICRSLHVCLWGSEGTYALCAYKHGDKVGSWSPTGTWLAGRDWTAQSALSSVNEDNDNIRLGIWSFRGGENLDCGCLGYDTIQFRSGRPDSRLLRNIGSYSHNCTVCLKMLVTGTGDECLNVLLISKLCGVFSFTLRQTYPSERACGTCWKGSWLSLKAVVHIVAKYLKAPSFVIKLDFSVSPVFSCYYLISTTFFAVCIHINFTHEVVTVNSLLGTVTVLQFKRHKARY